MQIITYNLRFGGSGKIHWAKILEDFDPDVFLVQESYDPIEHLPPLIHGDRHRFASWSSVSGRKWGSAVYVKNRLASRIQLPDFHGHVAGVKVDGSVFPASERRSLFLFSVHAPERGTYQESVNSILDMIQDNRGDSDLVIGGDFNLTVGERHESETMKTTEADSAILARLRGAGFGLVSAWQSANAGLPLPQTLRWSRDKLPPYHCDGIFIPERWTTRARCTILSGPEWDGLSDHNPVMVEIE